MEKKNEVRECHGGPGSTEGFGEGGGEERGGEEFTRTHLPFPEHLWQTISPNTTRKAHLMENSAL